MPNMMLSHEITDRPVPPALGIPMEDPLRYTIPSVPPTLRLFPHYIHGTVVNETKFPIELLGNHIGPGTFSHEPKSIDKRNIMSFSAHNLVIGTGCAGGSRFRIQISNEQTYEFALAFTNPVLGVCKASATAENSASVETAIEKATSAHSVLTCKEFTVVDEMTSSSYKLTIHIDVTPGTEPLYVVSQTYKCI